MFGKINLDQITKDNLENIACTDLGAFSEIGKNKFKNNKISGVVIMEDRLPDFFIGYKKFEPHRDTTLNRHGPFKFLFTQKHLKALIKELQEQAIKVYFGFWGQIINPHQKICLPFFDNHPELRRLHKENKLNYDLDPSVRLQPEDMSFAQYIVNQFIKFKQDFNFDGLFLGDGLNGYRLFINPSIYEDQAITAGKWTNFYQTICDSLHDLDCHVLAYDCLGLEPERALLHGADYLAQAKAGLDYLIIQTYPTAWGKKWLKNFSGFDFYSSLNNLQATQKKLKSTNCKTCYTLEMGDSVEDWQPKIRITKKQLKHYQPHADAKLFVWANELFYQLFK